MLIQVTMPFISRQLYLGLNIVLSFIHILANRLIKQITAKRIRKLWHTERLAKRSQDMGNDKEEPE
jgi:hypothetical protein